MNPFCCQCYNDPTLKDLGYCLHLTSFTYIIIHNVLSCRLDEIVERKQLYLLSSVWSLQVTWTLIHLDPYWWLNISLFISFHKYQTRLLYFFWMKKYIKLKEPKNVNMHKRFFMFQTRILLATIHNLLAGGGCSDLGWQPISSFV